MIHTSFLASVVNPGEALVAVAHGADIIDCKDPSRGALGALDVATVAAIRAAVPAHITVSATVGDLPSAPEPMTAAVTEMAGSSGCDIVKVGFFPGGDPAGAIAALGRLSLGRVRLAGLLFADREPEFALVDAMSAAGFGGAMLDTAGKGQGSLRCHLDAVQLSQFVARARGQELFAGLAGSLALSDVEPLMRLKPNVLGFRGALCAGSVRTGELSASAVEAIRAEIERARGLLRVSGAPVPTVRCGVQGTSR